MTSDRSEAYEVTVGNSQIVAFVALLTLALAGAFAAGVWWRQSNDLAFPEAETSSTPSDAARLDTPPPDAAQPEAGASGTTPSGTVASADAAATGEIEQGGNPEVEVARFFGASGQEKPPAETAAAAQDAASETLVVQVFSSADAAQAESVERKLRADGHPAFLSPQALAGQVMRRVRVGPFKNRAEATAAAELLAKHYGLETWITPNN